MIDIIQIGAATGYDEDDNDLIWFLMQQKKYSCVFVEPILSQFEKLKENYKNHTNCYFENLAITHQNGEVDLWCREDLRTATVHNNFSRGVKKTTVRVPCITLTELIKKYDMFDKSFYMLQIDAEGSDADILISTDFTHIRPRFIRFEHCFCGHYKIPSRDRVIKHLNQFGYSAEGQLELEEMFKFGKEESINTILERK